MKGLLLCTLAVLVLGSDACCREGWSQFKGSCYGYSNFQTTWGEAAAYCLSTGAKLAEVETPQENEFVKSFTQQRNGTEVWLGATDAFSEGKWVWISSGNLVNDFKDWFQSEPNNGYGEENCMEIRGADNYHWNDAICSVKKNFICEMRSAY